MDWFARLFGFREQSYADTVAKFVFEGTTLRSLGNGRAWTVGELGMASLADLRRRFAKPTSKAVHRAFGSLRAMSANCTPWRNIKARCSK